MHAEALRGHRVAVLQTRVANAHLRNAGPLRQTLGHVSGVLATLAHGQQQMLAFTRCIERGQLINLEILGNAAHCRSEHRGAMRARQNG